MVMQMLEEATSAICACKLELKLFRRYKRMVVVDRSERG